MASFNKFQCFVADVANKVHNLGSDTLKIMLSNTAPTATDTEYSDETDLSTANGYTAGGATVGITSSSQSSGTYKLIPSGNVEWTATGSVGPFRYAILYNSTPSNKNLIGWWDYGSSVTLASGDTFSVDLDGTNGILQLA